MDSFRQAFELLFSLDKELMQIIGVTLRMSFFSTTISCILGLPIGALIGTKSFKGKSFLKKLIHTLMGLPPVVAGLFVYMLFTHYGPFGSLNLLFTVKVMVIAQVILITPIVIGLSSSFIESTSKPIIETARGIGLKNGKIVKLCLSEGRTSLVSIVLSAFGRSIAEVGAVSIVGGNIQWKTRVMTTAIMLETNKGKFSFALALGIILLIIAFIVNAVASFIVKEAKDD
ncbi:MAG: ABC transporter permease subunit [Ruminococcaceae bacterium]|jgi:tungstate transport system permease protein|nr:ABC transporter permease subunit [Oscillospiraceae bacterium]